MSALLLGFPLAATAQARRGMALGCPRPLVDFRCAACGDGVGFAVRSDTLALARTTCRRCGELGRWRLDLAEAQAGSDAPSAPARTWRLEGASIPDAPAGPRRPSSLRAMPEAGFPEEEEGDPGDPVLGMRLVLVSGLLLWALTLLPIALVVLGG